MANLLIIDTSSSICSVVLDRDGEHSARRIDGVRAHGQFLLTLIRELTTEQELKLTDLSALAVISGPGSFTGIRIGIGVVQGLATALDLPVVLLSSLEWLAWTARQRFDVNGVVVCNRARDGEYYFASYRFESDSTVKCGGETLGDGSLVSGSHAWQSPGDWVAVGDGWEDADNFDEELLNGFRFVDCRLEGDIGTLCQMARTKLESGNTVPAGQAMPSYLKETMNYRTSG